MRPIFSKYTVKRLVEFGFIHVKRTLKFVQQVESLQVHNKVDVDAVWVFMQTNADQPVHTCG